MSTAGIFLDLNNNVLLWNVITNEYNLLNILLFAILMLLAIIPWIRFDTYLRKSRLSVNGKNINTLKSFYLILILLSIFCIVYCFPYAMTANKIGWNVVRINDDVSLLPANFLTTLCTGVATLTPVGVLLFFIGLLDSRLNKYAVAILLLPIAGIIHSMTFAARELYIYLPISFAIIYVAFKNSLSVKQKKRIKIFSAIASVFLIFLFISISTNRFGDTGTDSFISGTWGYIYQQPYVFDQTLQFFDNYKGYSKSLSFIGNIIGDNSVKPDIVYVTEYSFGTMYKGFYEMFGYTSLFIGALIYVSFFLAMSNLRVIRKNAFSALIVFSIFIWFTVSGIFYFRYGNVSSQFIMYLLIIVLSPLYPRFINVANITDYDTRNLQL